MSDINIDMLKDRLYKVSKALFCIGETCVEVSKQHISEEKALDKIRGYLNDAGMYSRFKVDQLIEDCMEPNVYDDFEKSYNDWFNKALSERLTNIDKFVYFADNDKLNEHKADANRIAEAVERTKKYMRE